MVLPLREPVGTRLSLGKPVLGVLTHDTASLRTYPAAAFRAVGVVLPLPKPPRAVLRGDGTGMVPADTKAAAAVLSDGMVLAGTKACAAALSGDMVAGVVPSLAMLFGKVAVVGVAVLLAEVSLEVPLARCNILFDSARESNENLEGLRPLWGDGIVFGVEPALA